LYGLHFVLFFTIHLKQPLDALLPKLCIVGIYTLLFVFLLTRQVNRWKEHILIFAGLLLTLLVLKLLFVQHFNIQFLYLWVVLGCFGLMPIKKDDIDFIVRITPLLYLVFALILHYTFFKSLSLYEVRQLPNRFLPQFLNRFIGITGSPAGPDIIYTATLFYTIFLIRKRTIDYFNIVISILVIIWTSSLSPLFAVILALPVLFLKRFKTGYFLLSMYYCFFLVILYNYSSQPYKHLLNVLTTLRVQIWDKVTTGLGAQNSLSEWLLGRREMIEFTHLFGVVDANPHNFTIYLLEFGGLIGLLLATVYFILKVQALRNKKVWFLVMLIFFYVSTNPIPFTIVDSPFLIYLGLAFLMYEQQLTSEPSRNDG